MACMRAAQSLQRDTAYDEGQVYSGEQKAISNSFTTSRNITKDLGVVGREFKKLTASIRTKHHKAKLFRINPSNKKAENG